MSTTSRRLVLGFALVGLGFAGYSAWVHYKLLTDASYVSPCDINSTFNCTQAYLSRFGSVAGVPVALGGVAWFALVALLAGLSGPAGDARAAKNEATGAYIFALATVGLAAVLYLGYASFFILKTGCVLCIGTYVSVAGIFVVSGLAASVSMTRLPLRFAGDVRGLVARPTTLLVTLLFLVGTASLVAFFPKEGARPQSAAPSQDQVKDFSDAWWAQPRQDLGIPADGAKVVVVKFNDYQCGACAQTHAWYKPVLDKFQQSHPGMVKFVLKDWPWNSKCNFNIPQEMHPGACEAAAAARMARDRGKYDEMETWLYGNTTASPQAVMDAARRILGVTDFAKEYAAKLPEIRRDAADGGALKIDGTPTLFINGVRIGGRGLMSAQLFELAITLELNKK